MKTMNEEQAIRYYSLYERYTMAAAETEAAWIRRREFGRLITQFWTCVWEAGLRDQEDTTPFEEGSPLAAIISCYREQCRGAERATREKEEASQHLLQEIKTFCNDMKAVGVAVPESFLWQHGA